MGQNDWTEHKSPDGRTYFYNTVTKASVWEKPDDLKSSTELLLANCPWKEYKSDVGRIYYHNHETKESVWTIPKELQDIKDRIEAEDKPPGSQEATTSSAARRSKNKYIPERWEKYTNLGAVVEGTFNI